MLGNCSIFFFFFILFGLTAFYTLLVCLLCQFGSSSLDSVILVLVVSDVCHLVPQTLFVTKGLSPLPFFLNNIKIGPNIETQRQWFSIFIFYLKKLVSIVKI